MAPQSFLAGPVTDFPLGAAKEIELSGYGKVLVSNVKGSFYATSHLCSHYKAPLIKGTFSPHDGRILCPWHGACFNVMNGDIEEAPGYDGLKTFPTRVADGQLFITADPETKSTPFRTPDFCQQAANPQKTVIIIGSGSGGFGCLENLRRSKFDGNIIVVSEESHHPIDRPKLSKKMDATVDSLLLRTEEQLADLGVEFRLGNPCIGVDKSRQEVTLKQGEVLRYDYLVLAPGGQPFRIPIPNVDSPNVYTLRTVKDANSIFQASKGARVAIIGSSFIAMEVASVISKLASSIAVIGQESVPFERVLGVKVGEALQTLHEKSGVKFYMKETVRSLVGDGGKATRVELSSGETVECDLVILGTGARPNTAFLKGTLDLQRDGSLRVDNTMKVIGEKNIYAVGDVARIPFDHGEARIEHWNVAQNQGRIAAIDIAGGKAHPMPVPYFWTVQYGKSLRYCGHAENYTDVVLQGSLEKLSFAAFYIEGGVIKAVASLAMDPVVSHCSELFRLGQMPSPDYVRAQKSVLDIPLGSSQAQGLCSTSSASTTSIGGHGSRGFHSTPTAHSCPSGARLPMLCGSRKGVYWAAAAVAVIAVGLGTYQYSKRPS